MSDTPEPTQQDLMRVVNRDRFVKEQLSSRCANLIQENLELVSIIQDLQRDLADIQQGHHVVASTTPPTSADNGDVVGEHQPQFAFNE
jgi:hypothetical protein